MDKQPPVSRIYVGNIPWNIDEITFYNTFQHIGQIYEARIIIDKNTNRSKGFGFITFIKEEDAQKAIDTMNGMELAGRPIKVNFATPHVPAVRPTVLPNGTINNFPLQQGTRQNQAPPYYWSVNNPNPNVDISNRPEGSRDPNPVHMNPNMINSINNPNMINPFYPPNPGYPYQHIPWNMIPNGHGGGYYSGPYPMVSSPHQHPHHHNPSSPTSMPTSTNNIPSSFSPTIPSSSPTMYSMPYYPIGASPTGQAIANNNSIGGPTTASSSSLGESFLPTGGTGVSSHSNNTSSNGTSSISSASPLTIPQTSNLTPTRDNTGSSTAYRSTGPQRSSPTTNVK